MNEEQYQRFYSHFPPGHLEESQQSLLGKEQIEQRLKNQLMSMLKQYSLDLGFNEVNAIIDKWRLL